MEIKGHEITKREWLLIAFVAFSAILVGYMYFCPAEWYIVFFIITLLLYIAVSRFLHSTYHYQSKRGMYTKNTLLLIGFESTLGLSTIMRFYEFGLNEIPLTIFLVIILNAYLLYITYKTNKKVQKELKNTSGVVKK